MSILPRFNLIKRSKFLPVKEEYEKHYQIIGANIKKLRREMGWSQDDLANRCNKLDRGKISKMENARADYMHSTLLEVCSALGKDIVYICTEH